MPAEMRRMRLEVTDLLAALHARFPERFDYLVVDPASAAGLEGFAARRRVAPFRVRSVTRDAWDERTVWSTLALSFGSRAETLLNGLGPEHLPHLQDLLIGWMDELASPRKPRIALAAPEGFEELADALTEKGEVTRLDLDSGADVPRTDVLFWMRPKHVTGEQLRGLERLLATGASVIIAGELREPREAVREDKPFAPFPPVESALDEIAAHFGVATERGLVLDTFSEELEFGGKEGEEKEKQKAAHWIRCIAPNQDFHRFNTQPNGTLLFRAPSPFTPMPARLSELGWTAEVLATSSDGTWIDPEPSLQPVALASLERREDEAAPKQALIVGLRHDHPWRGELVFLAAETPFADGFYSREHVAHRRLPDVLLKETTSSARLVLSAIDLAAPEPLPPFTAAARLAWRTFGIALPVVLLLLLVHGRGLGRGSIDLGRTLLRAGKAAALPAGALVVLLVLVRAARAVDAGLDLTAARANELSDAAGTIAVRAGAAGEIAATLYLSEAEQLPPPLRAPARELERKLAAFQHAGARLALERVVPESLDEPARKALEKRGIGSEVGATDDDGVTRVTRFACALRLARGDREVVLAFPDARSFERLEFRLAFALERLGGRAAPRVAFASDVPRLSAAEAYEYQKQGLFAPSGTDVFALARASLARNDLEVEHVNPRSPVMPEKFDVLVWLQPRRSIEPMLDQAVRYLVGGGKLVLAAQHFKLLSQQFRGGDFTPKLWPQPQNPDLEHLYFPELGIELVREVLFDALNIPIATESQVTGRRGGRDFERQDSALPFQIRLSAAGLAPHPMTKGLGDQAFLWANFIRLDAARLAALGIRATPLAFSSRETWSYAWTGGWIPDELLHGPAAIEKSSGAGTLGPLPLAVLFEGSFPKPEKPMRLNPPPPPKPEGADAPGGEAAPAEPPEPLWPASAPGELVLLGDSQFLENGWLGSEEFRGDQFLWNLVANMVFEGELAELATRTRTPPGFGLVEPRTRLLWRGAVVAAGPLALLLCALGFAALRRRGAPRP